MRDTMKPVRRAIFDVASGLVSYKGNVVAVYDEKVFTGETPNVYILLSTQQETDDDRTDCTWYTRSSIDVEIIAKSGSEVSKDVIDDISNQFMEMVAGLPGVFNVAAQSGFQIVDLYRESAITQNLQITQNESILRKITKFTFKILQQN